MDSCVATFETVNVLESTTFDDHQHSIKTDTMLFRHNSGLAQFREIEDLESYDAEVNSTAKVELPKQISKQKLSAMEKSNLVKKYLEAQGTGGYNNAQYGRQGNRHADAISCAPCGVRNFSCW